MPADPTAGALGLVLVGEQHPGFLRCLSSDQRGREGTGPSQLPSHTQKGLGKRILRPKHSDHPHLRVPSEAAGKGPGRTGGYRGLWLEHGAPGRGQRRSPAAGPHGSADGPACPAANCSPGHPAPPEAHMKGGTLPVRGGGKRGQVRWAPEPPKEPEASTWLRGYFWKERPEHRHPSGRPVTSSY